MINGHGDDTYKYSNITINFSSNVYNHFDHEELFCYLAEQLDYVVNYPEPDAHSLLSDLSKTLGINSDELIATNGATEAIYLIAQTFRRKHSSILMPTFSEYADACRIHEHRVSNIYSLDQLTGHEDIVWICNPNNPTGTVIDRDVLMETVSRHPDTLFVVDTSYAPFTLKPLITPKESTQVDNLILLYSMTKEFAIPGLRIGYLTANSAIIGDISRQRMPWSVNQMAICAARYLLAHKEQYTLQVETLIRERRHMAERLAGLKVIEVWPSDTHILLCKLKIGKASALKEYLATEHGILIRDASNFEGLDDTYFRIAIQTPEENEELIKHITEWIMI